MEDEVGTVGKAGMLETVETGSVEVWAVDRTAAMGAMEAGVESVAGEATALE
jgi:hypothetical protein